MKLITIIEPDIDNDKLKYESMWKFSFEDMYQKVTYKTEIVQSKYQFQKETFENYKDMLISNISKDYRVPKSQIILIDSYMNKEVNENNEN